MDPQVMRHAPDQRTAEKILENQMYQNVSGRFVQSHEYIAMERLYEIHCEGKYDLILFDRCGPGSGIARNRTGGDFQSNGIVGIGTTQGVNRL